jgi:hypothetical protein
MILSPCVAAGLFYTNQMSKIAGKIPLSYTHCAYCELPFTSDQESRDGGRRRTRDHFIPRSRLGKNTSTNIHIVCQYCNTLKANLLPFEFIYFLRCKINWKEYPSVNGVTYNESLLRLVRKNVDAIYNQPPKPIAQVVVPVSANPKKRKKREWVSENGVHYVTFGGEECPCVGFVDKALVGVNQYQNAYYHKSGEQYVFVVLDTLRGYSKEAVGKFIKPFFPSSPKKVESYFEKVAADCHLTVNTSTTRQTREEKLFLQSQTVEEFRLIQKHGPIVGRQLALPEPNFHYED